MYQFGPGLREPLVRNSLPECGRTPSQLESSSFLPRPFLIKSTMPDCLLPENGDVLLFGATFAEKLRCGGIFPVKMCYLFRECGKSRAFRESACRCGCGSMIANRSAQPCVVSRNCWSEAASPGSCARASTMRNRARHGVVPNCASLAPSVRARFKVLMDPFGRVLP